MSEFVESLHEVFERLGPISVRRMFGGHGIYHGACMFALVADGTLYLRADTVTAAEFDAAGLEPFTYQRRGRRVALSYRRAPDDILEDRELAAAWAHRALEAARRASRKQRKRRKSGAQTSSGTAKRPV